MIPFNFQVEPERFLSGGRERIKRDYFDDLKPKLEAMEIPWVDLLEAMTAETAAELRSRLDADQAARFDRLVERERDAQPLRQRRPGG